MMGKALIGVDLGGTKILSGRIKDSKISDTFKSEVPTNGSKEEVLEELIKSIDIFFNKDIIGIGIGVPSVVDIERGIVYDVQNIPSWKEVHLKEILENKYKVPVYVNNDANCFAVGEKHFGIAQNFKNFVGLTLGTGMAGGIIINDRLYNGFNCGAGEFGTMAYLDHNYEYYCSGQFFKNVYEKDGYEVYKDALKGDIAALKLYGELGYHLGKAIQAVLYAMDPEIIILGGSVSKAFDFFSKSMWKSLQSFEYKKTLERLKIEISQDPQIALLGAAALYYDKNE
jgi:glucokinase